MPNTTQCTFRYFLAQNGLGSGPRCWELHCYSERCDCQECSSFSFEALGKVGTLTLKILELLTGLSYDECKSLRDGNHVLKTY